MSAVRFADTACASESTSARAAFGSGVPSVFAISHTEPATLVASEYRRRIVAMSAADVSFFSSV